MKRTLSIDLETYSEVDIGKAGLYKYAENCEILLLAYAFDDEPVKIIDMSMTGKDAHQEIGDTDLSQYREEIPVELLEALTDPDVDKSAYNAAFERTVLSRYLGIPMVPEQWHCTMVLGYTLGMPGGLDKVGRVLGLSEDKQKLSTGKQLIRYFCKPCRATRKNGQRTRNLPIHDPEKWELFKEYCIRDVESERAIHERLAAYEPSERERALWCLDQRINDAGVLLDTDIVHNALYFDARMRAEWLEEAKDITGLANPNSNVQLIGWLNSKLTDTEITSVDKATRQTLLGRDDLPADVRRLIQLKNQLAKTSIRKYEAMDKAMCDDGRVHGTFQFYGANRTGRWAGRLVQLHNLPQNHLEDLDGDRELVRTGQYEVMRLLYSDPADVLSQLIRTAFIAGKGKRFIVADFSAIEARVIAWLADEKWRMDTFAKGGDIYCASASQMFHVPVVKHGENGHLRQKGKVAELACIAEGQLVLTDRGLVPIEEITKDMKLWDGESWVAHEGLIYRGEKEVISYDGLTATPDHLVYLRGQKRPVRFGIAAASGAHLVQTGDGGREIRLGGDYQSRKTMEQQLEPLLCADKVHGLWCHSVAGKVQPDKREVEGLSEMLTAKAGAYMAVQETDGCKIKMRECEGSRVQPVWGQEG